MENREIKLCVIGAGIHSSANIYPYLYYLKDAKVAANADLDMEKAKRIAAPFGIPRSYTDYQKMLEREQPDGVIICVSREFHATGAINVMERGSYLGF